MGMTWAYGKTDRSESIATIHRAFVQLTDEELTWLDQVPAAVGGRH